jgi:hypothetical protein
MYADLGTKSEQTEFHLMFTGANNNLGAVDRSNESVEAGTWSLVAPIGEDLSVLARDVTCPKPPPKKLGKRR